MLALATTTVTVQGLATGGTDAHGAPVAGEPPRPRGPYPAHGDRGTTVTLEDGREVRGATWYLPTSAWPITQGEVIADPEDGTRWQVEGAQRQGDALGLGQAVAYCTQLAVTLGQVAPEPDPGVIITPDPDDPGTFAVTGLTEDPADPGTMIMEGPTA